MRAEILQHRALNNWPLLALITALTAAAMGVALSAIGLATPQANIDMIRLSVLLASPWLFITFVASPLTQLFRNDIAKWFMRNRRYFGLSFAAVFG
jgi:sulfoxide reductase heme-binding subunit YedZ